MPQNENRKHGSTMEMLSEQIWATTVARFGGKRGMQKQSNRRTMTADDQPLPQIGLLGRKTPEDG
jgi:hypothetical protein